MSTLSTNHFNMKNTVLFIILISGATLFAQNNSAHLVVKVGQPNFDTPASVSQGILEQDISKSFGIGLENVHWSQKRPNIGFSWGFIPTYQKLTEYSEQTYEASNADGTIDNYKNTHENEFRFIDLAIPLKIIRNVRGLEISAGLTPVYHANVNIKSYQNNYNVALPDQKWEEETTSHLCHDWIGNCGFETVSYDYPIDFWASADLGYRYKKFKLAIQYEQNLTRSRLLQGGSDFILIDVAFPFGGFWGNTSVNTHNFSLQMSYQLF